MSRYFDLRHGLWMASLAIAVPSQIGNAQPADSASVSTIDEVVVTARKREENLQDVPLAVTAISSAQILREGIRSVEDVVTRDPSLSLRSGYRALRHPHRHPRAVADARTPQRGDPGGRHRHLQ